MYYMVISFLDSMDSPCRSILFRHRSSYSVHRIQPGANPGHKASSPGKFRFYIQETLPSTRIGSVLCWWNSSIFQRSKMHPYY